MYTEFAWEINDHISFVDLIRNFQNPGMQEHYADDQRFQFFKQCQNQGVVALPILFKILNKKLVLNEYTLNTGLCESLASSFSNMPGCIKQISLTQNGLKDAQLAIII